MRSKKYKNLKRKGFPYLIDELLIQRAQRMCEIYQFEKVFTDFLTLAENSRKTE
jgi:hypothetical protein